MHCCANCFNDKEIIGFIFENSTEKGDCNFCGAKNTELIDTRELEEMFQPIVALFKTVAELGIIVPHNRLMSQKLQELWNLFKIADEAVFNALLIAILSDTMAVDDPLLTSPVEVEALFKPSLAGDVHEKKWENLAQEIKYKNRFFLQETVDLGLLANLLGNFEKTYSKGKIFYRARVSDVSGFSIGQMGKPPADKATPGRANPTGIPYLYVSTNIETTLYESRSSYLDYITIAECKLNEALKAVSLREISAVSPFIFGDQVSNYIAHQRYLARLEMELSKPIRRFDKELDYLPSQYLCEYVKSLGYDAIEYGSSLHHGGINLAIFNDTKLSINAAEVYEISSVEFKFQKLATP